jgi:hypothetical protein
MAKKVHDATTLVCGGGKSARRDQFDVGNDYNEDAER